MLRTSKFLIPILLFIFVIVSSCNHENDWGYPPINITHQEYKTRNVIIIVVDGQRYSEGWGDSTHQYIPRMAGILSQEGVVNTSFYNMGGTYTLAGHTALTTVIYQTINNGGLEYPTNPSIFQYWNQAFHNNPIKSWIITSKDKLAVLGDCTGSQWKGKYTPSVNSGVDGLGLASGYREDSLTLKTAIEIMKKNHPNLVLINFREPDYSGHTGIWKDYIEGVRKSDEYVYRIWQFLNEDRNYKNTTTIFVTNDHGRHLDNVADGFASHGDDCEGCRHLNFYAFGPDFRKGKVISIYHEQIDISVTIAELLGFTLPNSKGKVMSELFGNR
ncbi:MAG TPA: sulfatase [Prolixibacteraceae bacterium]|nr:sulfatase [Prolixibacteraceae bacterium]